MKGRGAGTGIGVIAAVALALWLASDVSIVREDEQAVVTTFGRFEGIRKAGLNWRMPYPIQRHETVRVT